MLRGIYVGLTLWASLICAPFPVGAQEAGVQQFSTRVGTPVSKATEALSAGDYQTGLDLLNQAFALDGLTPFEQSNIEQMRGSALYYLDRLPEAVSALETAINIGGLSSDAENKLIEQLAQMKIANGQFADGAMMLEDWLIQNSSNTSKHAELLMQAWLQAGRYEKALPWAQMWFETARPKERKHYDGLNYILHQLNDKEQQIDLVKDMIARWPDERALWDSWAYLLSETGQESDAFHVKILMYEAGRLTEEADILQLVQYYGYFEIPYDGAKILEHEMNAGRVKTTADTLKKLSNLYRQAREYERAIPVLRTAAQLQPDTSTYAELAEALIHQNACADAEQAFNTAIELGYPTAKPWMLVGTCLYEQAQSKPKPTCDLSPSERQNSDRVTSQNRAIDAFSQVTAPGKLRADAQTWQSFIRAEQQAIEDRCAFLIELERGRCFAHIRRAYENATVTGEKLAISDEACHAYIAAYDAEFRPKKLAFSQTQP